MITVSFLRSIDVIVDHLKSAVVSASMGLIGHINGQANAAKQGISVRGDQILEVFRPDFAVRVWAADKRAGLDIPIRYHVYEEGQMTNVTYRAPTAIFAPYGNAQLNEIGRELDRIFSDIMMRVKKCA